MILKCRAVVDYKPKNKDLVVSTLRQLGKIESETITKRSALEVIGRIKERLRRPEPRALIDESCFFISRWAERLVGSSPRVIFNLNTPGITVFLQSDELDIVFNEQLIPVYSGVMGGVFEDGRYNEAFHLLWRMKDDFVFVPFRVISSYGPRGIFDVTEGLLKNRWDFGVEGVVGVTFSEEYFVDGSVKLGLKKDDKLFATIRFAGPVARLPTIEEIPGF